MPDLVDARGLSCPQPAFLTKKALDGLQGGRVEVLVDNQTSRDNVKRLAERAGWTCEAQSEPDGVFRLVISR